MNLGILGFFKYFNFFLDEAVSILIACGWEARVAVEHHPADRHLLLHVQDPQLHHGVYGREWSRPGAGSITLPRGVLPPASIRTDRSGLGPAAADRDPPRIFQRPDPNRGWLFIVGPVQKVVVADNLADLANPAFSPDLVVSTSYAWTALYAYALQLYCDFSGYTDMARGMAMMLGFDLINFESPISRESPRILATLAHQPFELDARLHLLSLGCPCASKKHVGMEPILAAFLTMVLMPVARCELDLCGVRILLGCRAGPLQRLSVAPEKEAASRGPVVPLSLGFPFPDRTDPSMVLLFHAVCFGFVLFRFPRWRKPRRFFGVLFGSHAGATDGGGLATLNAYLAMLLLYFPVLVVQIQQERRGDLLYPLSMSLLPRVLLYAVMAILLLTLGKTDGGAFIYIQF